MVRNAVALVMVGVVFAVSIAAGQAGEYRINNEFFEKQIVITGVLSELAKVGEELEDLKKLFIGVNELKAIAAIEQQALELLGNLLALSETPGFGEKERRTLLDTKVALNRMSQDIARCKKMIGQSS